MKIQDSKTERAGWHSAALAGMTAFVGAQAKSTNPAPQQLIRKVSRALTSAATLLCCVLFSAFCLSAVAQYSVDWFKVAGGGGTSTNGQYSVSGTIGQHDAGQMSGGQYTLTGGFWALPIAVQTPGGPTLTIAPDVSGKARISWLPAAPGYVLQFSPTLNPSAWTNAPSGATNPVVVPATLPARYYRLIK